jgi:hypothetical protein
MSQAPLLYSGSRQLDLEETRGDIPLLLPIHVNELIVAIVCQSLLQK